MYARTALCKSLAFLSVLAIVFLPGVTRSATDDRESFSFDDLTRWDGLMPDRAEVREGIQSGAWSDTVAVTRVRYRGPELDLSGAKAARFWLHSREATGARIALVLLSESPTTTEPDYYYANVTINFSGWREITLPFAEMKVIREPRGFGSVNGIVLASSGYACGDPVAGTALLLDDLRFVGEESAAPAATGGAGVVPLGYEVLFGFEDALLWKGLIADSEAPTQGLYCARWQGMAETNRITPKSFPTDLSGYDRLAVSIWSAAPTGAQIALVLTSENPATEGADYYTNLVTIDWTGWREVEIPLGDFLVERSPLGMSSITGFRMASDGYKIKKSDPATVLKFDNMRLIPKGK